MKLAVLLRSVECRAVTELPENITSYRHTLTLDGKENDDINIEGIPDYEMPQADEIDGAADVEFHLESEDDSEDNADEKAEYEADETVGVQ